MLASLVIVVIVARDLGPAQFAAYAYMVSLVGLFAPVVTFGLDAIVLRAVASRQSAWETVLGAAVFIRIVCAAVAVAAAVGAAGAFGGPAGVSVELVSVLSITLMLMPTDTLNACLRAQERMALVALPRSAVIVLVVFAVLVCAHLGLGLAGFIALRALEAALLAAAAMAAFVGTAGRLAGLRSSLSRVTPLAREAWPLFLGSLAVIIYTRIDQIMLGQMAAEGELGLYGVAVRVSEAAAMLSPILYSAFFPSLVRAHVRAPGQFDAHMQRLYDIMALASFVVIAATALVTALFLVPVFGSAYASSSAMVLILLLPLPAVFLGGAVSAMLTIRGWLWTLPLMTATGAGANILLNLALIPDFGGNGAAWATAISYWLTGFGLCFVLPWLRPTGARITRALNPIAAIRRTLVILRSDQRALDDTDRT